MQSRNLSQEEHKMKNLVKTYVSALKLRNEAAAANDFSRRDQANAELAVLAMQVNQAMVKDGLSLDQVNAMMQQERAMQTETEIETIPEKFAWIRLLTEAIDRKLVNRTHTTVQRLSRQYAQVCVN
jgi:hypothetical protein